MSQSSPIVQELRRGKRPRSSIPITSSFLKDSGDSTCSACERETGMTSSDCITFDLTPSDYFRLALTITDPTAHNLLQDDNEDYTTKCLIKNARRLAVDQELALNVILMLHPLMANYYKEGVSKLIPVMKKTRLHKARELRFVQACLGEVKSSTFDLVMEQFKQCVRESVELGKIIMSDVRYARLLPLLCFLKDVSSGEAGDVIEISQSDSHSQVSQQRVGTGNYHVINDSDCDQLGSSGSIIDITSDSYSFVIAPSVPEYSSYYSPSLNGGDQDLSVTLDSQGRVVDPFGIRHSSQTPDRNMSYSTIANIPSPVSKDSSTASLSIIDPPLEISSRPSSSQASSSQLVMPSPQRSISQPALQQQHHLTDYEELSTAELKAKLKSFGFKTSNSRPQMIQDLKNIQMSIDSQRSSQQTSAQGISSLQSMPELTSNSQVSAVEPNKRMEIIQHLKSRSEIWQKISMYNTVSIDECMIGIHCKRGEMRMVLDEFAAAKGSSKRHLFKK
ncbi:hypothetical protein MAM1_0057c03675 [Mucor ambiguus]|uniref:SAP domain-containing protein n=1 Tax=Mucor ambiguus TaxID=91626 RepID=A0A0C9LTZ8_9FUNG|nr:hypothetical protein MAM1_0057c03675 [Mucor ambiguus]